MDTMRKKVLWTGGLAACVLAVAMAVRAADSGRPDVAKIAADTGELVLLKDVNFARLEPIPDTYVVRTQYPDGDPRNNSVLAGTPPDCFGEAKEVYSSKLGQVLFRPGAGNRVADDLVTELVRPCTLCSFSIRVTGGVEDGDGEFIAEVTLYDGCPDTEANGQPIPGTLKLFTGLEDDIGIFHDLVLDFGDRGVCTDGSACKPSLQNCGDGSDCLADPLEVPTEIWARIRFNSSSAAIVVGTPPVRGFSADGYDDVFGNCRNFFGGFPSFAHATFYTQVFTPVECETHFLAYLAANPIPPAFLPTSLPGGTPTTRLADDVNLTVPNCTLSAYEVGVKGTSGDFLLKTDIRWPAIANVVPETVAVFPGRGLNGSLEVAHTTIDENVNLNISDNDQPIFISWEANKGNTGVPEVGRTQAGFSTPQFFAFDTDIDNPGLWTAFSNNGTPGTDPSPPGNRGIYYAAVFCRGDAPRGACCFNQPEIPGADIACVDDLAVTSCLGARWGLNATCAQNIFDPPCGTHACCLPDNSTQDLLFDDCREECTLDENPITCFPVCNGGQNDGLPCVQVCTGGQNDGLPCADQAECPGGICDPDGECPDGVCDPDGKCPGQRTCGLTGCMLGGQFTGRPCDPNNPGAGSSDCMTCSGTGEYCRPRCIGGTRPGRTCDPNDTSTCPGDPAADPPIAAGICEVDFDCPGIETCGVHAQTCETDPDQCSLRCARWEPGEFKGENDFECPNFTCFDAEGDCFEGEGEIQCFGRCSGAPDRTCRFDSDCAMVGAGVCVETDIDCPDGRACANAPFNVCTGRAGCDNLLCCKEVCKDNPVCCEGSLGQGWDLGCADFANDNCTNPPGNDNCWSDLPNEGAAEFDLIDDVTQLICSPSSVSCSAAKVANNGNANSGVDDPEVCCNADGVNQRVLGTIWYKFTAVHDSARIDTCNTPGNPVSVDSVIQVFQANNITPNGNDFDECNSLEVIGCNDDAGCGTTGEQASVCVINLTPGETYFVMMGSKRGENLGQYEIDITTPCPAADLPEPGNQCEVAINAGAGATPFDLASASLDCPPETSLPGMSNDQWFDVLANFCDGPSVLTVQTCGFDLGEPNPATTLAVYSGTDCPPTLLVQSNDDATVNPICSLGGRACEMDADCNKGCTGPPPIGGTACNSDADCPGTSTCDLTIPGTCQTTVLGSGSSTNAACDDDSGCTRGICADNPAEACDLATFTELHCPNGDPCVSNLDCAGNIGCAPACGFMQNSSTPVDCVAQESCVLAVCESECAPASFAQVPTFPGGLFKIRIGGEFGGEPSGTLRISCERDDCNNNSIPDLLDISNGIEPDCNQNGEPDSCDLASGASNDCNCNGIPDECDIDREDSVDCSVVVGPCEDGPFYCESFVCDVDNNHNGIPDCCDADEPPAICPDCPPTGACCDAGGCTIQEAADCTGVYVGDGTTCDVDTCTLGSCCQADLTCRADEVASQCVAAGETFRSGVDCTTACPPTCSFADVTNVVWADAAGVPGDQPGNCAIDARQPHDINDAAATEGWDRLILTFSCDPATIGVGGGDFSISTTPAGTMPGIQSVLIDSVANTVTVQLDGPITPGQWTCITHDPSTTMWCAGYLPADANQDSLSNANDINGLINSLNNVPGFVLPAYATDMDRSGAANSQDILRLIDLLNGAGQLDVWLAANLPACPSLP